uniref:Uncharacterized protein n=1 Tax=Anguilla anguilla TaxID=7936 RepID=A0A0E9WMA2_ANGAN
MTSCSLFHGNVAKLTHLNLLEDASPKKRQRDLRLQKCFVKMRK